TPVFRRASNVAFGSEPCRDLYLCPVLRLEALSRGADQHQENHARTRRAAAVGRGHARRSHGLKWPTAPAESGTLLGRLGEGLDGRYELALLLEHRQVAGPLNELPLRLGKVPQILAPIGRWHQPVVFRPQQENGTLDAV